MVRQYIKMVRQLSYQAQPKKINPLKKKTPAYNIYQPRICISPIASLTNEQIDKVNYKDASQLKKKHLQEQWHNVILSILEPVFILSKIIHFNATKS